MPAPHTFLVHLPPLVLLLPLLVAGCSGTTPESAGLGEVFSSPSCQPAPRALIDELERGQVVTGATLSHVYVVEAAGLTGGPDLVRSASFVHPQWIAARITGAGVRPEVAVWVASRADADGQRIVAADAAARRYSSFGPMDGPPITGAGLAEARRCVGPIPEP